MMDSFIFHQSELSTYFCSFQQTVVVFYFVFKLKDSVVHVLRCRKMSLANYQVDLQVTTRYGYASNVHFCIIIVSCGNLIC